MGSEMANGHEIAMALRGAYLAMHRQADAAVAPFGLTANQFVLLALLDERDGVSQRDLVERASSDPNTIRPMLTALETKGLVDRQTDPDDGRAWLVSMTAKGRRLFRKARKESEEFRERLCSNLSGNQQKSLVRMLSEVADTMNSNTVQQLDE